MNDEVKPGDTDALSADAPKDTDKSDLNSLLESWDDKPKPSSDDTPPKTDDNPLAAEVARLSYEREMDKLIPMVKGDLKVSDRFVEAYMNMRANDDQRLRSLWDNRHDRRSDFDQAMKAMADELATEIGKPPDKDPPDDGKGGLAAAVHAAREVIAAGGELDTLDFGGLSDHDFALKKAEVFRLVEQGKLK